jgi:hypothetical protein
MKDDRSQPNLQQSPAGAEHVHLLRTGLEGFDAFVRKARWLDKALGEISEIGGDEMRAGASRLKRQLASFEPSITMIGQVKAGKTTLVNAMIGRPGLLPADVNPWTSVITSLHLDPDPATAGSGANFRFFEKEEWTRLLEKGGRIGELASRAGAGEELEKIRDQIAAMRAKSRSRLGRRFELLLGQEHDYASFDAELVERYICLGDDYGDDEGEDSTQGRFADITKTADLHMLRPELPLKLCIRDTPGVNDTFMVREQITIRAIRESRVCVVVLSAHQALSSVDLALIRLISNLKSRDVVIFVNRIDELSDPAQQIPEIRQAIRTTLERHEGPADAKVVFGSAYWGENALMGTLDRLAPESAAALLNLAEAQLEPGDSSQSPLEFVWELSGIPALFAALSERIVEGDGQEAIDRVARKVANLLSGIETAHKFTGLPKVVRLRLDKNQLADRLDQIAAESLKMLEREFELQIASYFTQLDSSHRNFLHRATASLVEHLENKGENVVWSYEPTGLRLLLRSACRAFAARVQRKARRVFEATASDLSGLYRQAFGMGPNFQIEAPSVPNIPPPVVIGQTIALDIRGNWWKSWWQRRRGYEAYASGFFDMIKAETDPILQDLKITQADAVRRNAEALLKEFLEEQRRILLGLAENPASHLAERETRPERAATEERLKSIRNSMAKLTRNAA